MRLQAKIALVAALVALAACGPSAPHRYGPPPDIDEAGFYLSTSFEKPVCGNYHHPDEGCEFGIQGEVRTGEFDCRTGASCLAEERSGSTHMGAIRDVTVTDGHAFVGAAFKVPELPPAQKPFIELMQLSPGDGTEPLNPIELRIYTADRTLSIAEFKGGEQTHTTWQVPIDEWFAVVVEMSYGEGVPTRMWVYGPDDRLAEEVESVLTTSGGRGKAQARQKIGGVTNTFSEVVTYADDWYIADRDLGPLHIGPDGEAV